jgi:hypothetical protein
LVHAQGFDRFDTVVTRPLNLGAELAHASDAPALGLGSSEAGGLRQRQTDPMLQVNTNSLAQVR